MHAIDPDVLRSFLAISETGSYGAAAERVNKTQSTLSAQMKRLEEVLGVSLFERVGRRNALSPDGLRLLEYARSMVRLNDETINAFRPPDISGTIKIGTSDDYAQAFLPRILANFARTHAAVAVQVVTATSQHLIPRLETDRFDALIVSCRPGDADIEALRTDQLHWIGAEGHRIHDDDPLPLALWPEGCAWRDMGMAALARAGRDWRLAYTTSNAPLLAATVADGLGVTVAPRWFLGPGLRVLDTLDAACPLGQADIGIKVRPGAECAALSVFLDHLRSHLRAGAQIAA